MAISRPVRIPEESHELAEKLALIATQKKQKIITKNDILKEAVEIGLLTIEKKLKR